MVHNRNNFLYFKPSHEVTKPRRMDCLTLLGFKLYRKRLNIKNFIVVIDDRQLPGSKVQCPFLTDYKILQTLKKSI